MCMVTRRCVAKISCKFVSQIILTPICESGIYGWTDPLEGNIAMILRVDAFATLLPGRIRFKYNLKLEEEELNLNIERHEVLIGLRNQYVVQYKA